MADARTTHATLWRTTLDSKPAIRPVPAAGAKPNTSPISAVSGTETMRLQTESERPPNPDIAEPKATINPPT